MNSSFTMGFMYCERLQISKMWWMGPQCSLAPHHAHVIARLGGHHVGLCICDAKVDWRALADWSSLQISYLFIKNTKNS